MSRHGRRRKGTPTPAPEVASAPAAGSRTDASPHPTDVVRSTVGRRSRKLRRTLRKPGVDVPLPEPPDPYLIKTVAAGTAVWFVAFLVLLPFRSRLEAAGQGWWPWTCLAGVGLGLLGLYYCRRRRDAILRDAQRDAAARPAPGPEAAGPTVPRAEAAASGEFPGANERPAYGPSGGQVPGPQHDQRPGGPYRAR